MGDGGTGVQVGGHVLHASAVAGVASCCYLESVDVAFDMGVCFGFVTHAGRRSLQSMPPAKYYVPQNLAPHMQAIMDSFAAMQEAPIPAIIVPVHPFDEIHLSSKWMVKAFPTCHRVPSLGYILYAKRSKLRDDLVGCDSKAIAALRKSGESVTSVQMIPEIAYTGDTTVSAFTSATEQGFGDLLRVKTLITEATYIDETRTADDATSRGHIHLQQLIALEDLFAGIQSLVLVHSSARYPPSEIASMVMTRLPSTMRAKVLVAGR